MKKIWIASAALLLVLSGCGAKSATSSSAPVASTAASSTAKSAASTPAPVEETPAAASSAVDSTKDALSETQAEKLVTETLDPDGTQVSLTDTQLSVGDKEKEAHDYYVFDVKDAQGNDVGQIAIDKQTGEKYNYLGEGTIDDYATFPLYDASVDAVCNWDGAYAADSMTLEILQGDSNSFEYHFSDGTGGNAKISGNTAKSSDGAISFVYSDASLTVAGGNVTGEYKKQ